MAVRSGDLLGDDTKDISAATCSLPPSDLITRSMSDGRVRKFFTSTLPIGDDLILVKLI
jgi:hypothetical protein